MNTTSHPAFVNPLHLLERTHPQIMGIPMMGDRDLERLTAAIKDRGVERKISLSHDGLVIDGRNRIAAAIKAGLDLVPVEYLDEKINVAAFALDSAVSGRNLTKSGIVLLLFLEHPDLAGLRAARAGGYQFTEKGQRTGDSITSSQEKGKQTSSFHDVADRYNVPREYFTFLSKIREACTDDEWEGVVRSILDDETSITAYARGIAGKEATKGKQRSDPHYHRLTCMSAVTMENAFKNWGTIAWNEKFSREAAVASFGQALLVAPNEIRAIETDVIIGHWTDHDREQLFKQLKKQVDSSKKAKKAKKIHKGM